ncbi:uncharacterized protein TRIVIDRAFT_31057 [Trichoderma virens Gv29-8]|uniref:Uncharacterized protein n=1 Tax=Hypocrea virens (strain Gv29-8 / FGSC 10586) TaxID=413071 RepID=G9ML48_HYPVG|nr:uncharacterized protein TRIVIDRAFT_31057 [Trichoderma virens Gv29-8]EHK24942.1 hypothetical protein TRIVIDRAFT_31057 [Trichoderma virens Gv29-8]UKZ55208.1 hypothetical protein TrVGV298_009026 [Trichoderma virens]
MNNHQPQSDEPEAQKNSGIWRIHWRSPTSMIGLFVGATCAAVAHHLYYDSINGAEVVIVRNEWTLQAVRDSQEWKLRFGAGLAFLAKAMFAASVIVAYEQRAWLTARNKAVTVSGLDAMFSAAQNPLSFFSLDFLRKAKAGAIMALLVWCIPLAAVITPGTLIVVPTTLSTSKSFPVPAVNFSQVQPLYDYYSSVVGNDGQSTSNGITPYLSRLISSTATSSQILPMNIALANSTYNLTFHGPSFRCREPTNYTIPLQNVSSLEGYSQYNHGRLWVWAQNITYDCVLTDTEYSTRFFYSASEQVQRIDPEYGFKWTEEDLYGNYFYVADALSTLLGGAVRVFLKGVMSYKTRVADTAVFGALKVDSTDNPSSGLLPKSLAPEARALARNKTVGELIEELSRNITLSLFSADQILYQNDTMVKISSDVNVYSYNRRVLIITYVVVFSGTLIALLIGGAAYFQNGVSHQVSFSAFMSTTRNYRLDELTAGSSMGAMPLRDSIQSTKLQLGFLRNVDEEVGEEEAMRRVGFGLSDQIVPLQKGVPYY